MIVKVAAAQTADNGDYRVNLAKAEKYITEAAEQGASLILFPEAFMSVYPRGTDAATRLAASQTLDGPFAAGMSALAKQHKIWTVFGMNEPADEDHNYNTTVIFNDNGEFVSKYRKTHLFDAFSYRESDHTLPGDHLFEAIDTPFGRLGLLVCYELRFPEIARYETLDQKADILLVLAAWNRGPKKAEQMRMFIQTRAAENNVFAVLSDMCGEICEGKSCVVDPFGTIIKELGEEEGLLIAELDMDYLADVRRRIPALGHRRPELY